jgi:hypothetical protein
LCGDAVARCGDGQRVPSTTCPGCSGGSLVNLVAELVHCSPGTSASRRLQPTLASRIPKAKTCVLVRFDGLGALQLELTDPPISPTPGLRYDSGREL